MSNNIPVAFVDQYHADVEMLLQQKGSRLRECVRVEDQKGEVQFWDQIGPTEAEDITNRHGDSPQVDSEHLRRSVALQFFDWGDFIDKIDKVRMLQDPTNAYTQNAVYALGRKFDRIVISAFFADAKTGHAAGDTTQFDTDLIIPVNLGGTNVGLTVPKLVRAKKFLLQGENDMDEPMYIGYAAQQMEDMLNLTQVTSTDYNSVKALVRGDVSSFMGFEFKHTELLTHNGTSRLLPVWAKSGLLLAISPDVETAVERRWDKRGSVYVYAAAGAGATRMQEPKVIQILCLETL